MYIPEELKQYYNNLEEAVVDANIPDIFENLLVIAVEIWASDIHIEPYENSCRIRLRIDWVLQELIGYPKSIHDSVIAKFKIETGQMRPDEKRLPQDARISTIILTWKEIDLRANTLPTVWWEKLVMRIVDKSKKLPSLDKLGIEGVNNDILFRNLTLPNGIILNTWPTWSWKTTTLYAALNYINTPEVNITTYEDPVEIKMYWLNQSQIRSDIGYTFATGLRAALRQDPDIIMVWEIRDYETLEIAMEAAMTWHLVLSTVHTNSAAETITRVLNLGAQPYMIWWTFNLVIAQRLWRTICSHCKVKVNAKEEFPKLYEAAKLALVSMEKDKLIYEIKNRWISSQQWEDFKNGYTYIWKWCDKCWWTWYKWRIWIYEMMEYTDDLKNNILLWKTAFDIEFLELKKWMINLERDGIFKAIKWLTTLKEIYRLTKPKDYKKILELNKPNNV